MSLPKTLQAFVFWGLFSSFKLSLAGPVDATLLDTSLGPARVKIADFPRISKANLDHFVGPGHSHAFPPGWHVLANYPPPQSSPSVRDLPLLKQHPALKEVLPEYRKLVSLWGTDRLPMLGADSKKIWKNFGKNFRNLDEADFRALEQWELRAQQAQGKDAKKAVANIKWFMQRATQDQAIWWGEKDMRIWQAKNYNVLAMVKIGDLLHFEERNVGFFLTQKPTVMKEILSVFMSSPLKEMPVSKPGSLHHAEEIVALLSFLAAGHDKPLYDLRVTQLMMPWPNMDFLEEETRLVLASYLLGVRKAASGPLFHVVVGNIKPNFDDVQSSPLVRLDNGEAERVKELLQAWSDSDTGSWTWWRSFLSFLGRKA